ncbi:hypothetical protein CBS101457_002023 [Exobasidium rhododendri]|nr:hypothetical protein CBS101457_002023 [Exobasidium rhododendri]
MASPVLRPVIVITGANSGVGFGLAQRLLVQLSSPTPPDTLPTHPHLTPSGDQPPASPFAAPNGCVLILACRNAIKAHRARAQLQALLQYLEDLPDDAETPLSVPTSLFDLALESKVNGSIDEDADPALVAQAVEASMRRRRRRNKAVSLSSSGQEADEERDLTRDPKTGRTFSLYEREIKARGKYRRKFCAETKIEFQALDLGSMASALTCAKEITARHHYVTHIVLNAGSSAFTGINWFHAVWMVMTSFHAAVTYPQYKLQRAGDVGRDGYGWVWQANLGAHYILIRALLPALRATPYSTPSRIIWTGSLEAQENKYTPSDFQGFDLIKTPKPYESAKYQCELAALGLEELLDRSRMRTQPGTPLPYALEENKLQSSHRSGSGVLEPKCYLAHPGVVASSIFAACLNAFLSACMKFAFYLARWTFSKHHNIEGYKGAVAASHVALAPSSHLDTSTRYGAQSDFFAREYVFAGKIDGWYTNTPSGPAKEEKQELFEASLTQQPEKEYGQQEEGKYVRALARDVIIKCEGVAKRVWKEAREGALPPFSELKEDGSRVDEGETKEQIKASMLSLNLLPRVDGANETEGLPHKDDSFSSQEEWEKVDGAV